MNLNDYKNIIATTASISTILQFLAGIIICQKIVVNKSTGDLSPFPFISGCLSTSLWLIYGFVIDDTSIILVNTVGSTLFFAYVVTFYLYVLKKSAVVRQFLVCFSFLIIVLLYIQNEDKSVTRNHLGLICCCVTILFFAAPFASFMHVIRVRSSESLPFPLISSAFIVTIQWLIYGIILGDPFIKIPNFLGCVLSAIQLSLFCLYPKPHKIHSSELI